MRSPVSAMVPSLETYRHRLERLNQVFLEENQKLNLSAFRREADSWIGNVLDSLAIFETGLLAPGLEEENTIQKQELRVLDLGTGGGFPLLPLAVCCPAASFTGMDATQKKIAAVERIVQEMKIPNVSLVTGRAEELGHDAAHREQYDLVLSRAVAPMNVLLEYCAPFAKVGGHVVLWKSTKITQELQDALLARAELSCQLKEHYEYSLENGLPAEAQSERSESKGAGWGKRQLVIFHKRFTTKEKYPREVGVPKKKPLL